MTHRVPSASRGFGLFTLFFRIILDKCFVLPVLLVLSLSLQTHSQSTFSQRGGTSGGPEPLPILTGSKEQPKRKQIQVRADQVVQLVRFFQEIFLTRQQSVQKIVTDQLSSSIDAV
jgi:hypothetical protein